MSDLKIRQEDGKKGKDKEVESQGNGYKEFEVPGSVHLDMLKKYISALWGIGQGC